MTEARAEPRAGDHDQPERAPVVVRVWHPRAAGLPDTASFSPVPGWQQAVVRVPVGWEFGVPRKSPELGVMLRNHWGHGVTPRGVLFMARNGVYGFGLADQSEGGRP